MSPWGDTNRKIYNIWKAEIMMEIKALEEIGLTKGEIKVYLALLKTGQSSSGAIAKEAQVSRSKLYSILDKLSKKGLIGHILKGKVMYFEAMEPRRIINYIDDKNKQLEEKKKIIESMLPELEKKQNKKQNNAALHWAQVMQKQYIFLALIGENQMFRCLISDIAQAHNIPIAL